MRLSIRNQILIPILGIQAVAVATITLATASLGAGRVEREIVGLLNGVIDTLGHANFPYTAGVLAQMQGLSGAHYAVFDRDGRVTAATLAGLATLPPALRDVPRRARLDSLGDLTTFVLDGTTYFAAPLATTADRGGPSLLLLYPETSWRAARWEAATPPLALGLGTLATMAAVTSWIAQRIGARIRRVERQVARIAAGDFEGFDPGPRDDEIRELASSINLMCDRLSQMQRVIARSERTRLLAQLAAGLAHQLRNSLTGARLSVQLHARRFPPREGDETLGVALRQLAMTEEQVKGLLALGRVEPARRAPCDLGPLLEQVAALVGPSCQHAGVALRHERGPAPCVVPADAAGLRSAVLNLTLNAIEAAGAGGEVTLRVVVGDGDAATVEVGDDGPGPAPAVADHLLEPFVTSKAEGVGLGLTIAARVAAEHGGRLSWDRRDGRTRFHLSLSKEAE